MFALRFIRKKNETRPEGKDDFESLSWGCGFFSNCIALVCDLLFIYDFMFEEHHLILNHCCKRTETWFK